MVLCQTIWKQKSAAAPDSLTGAAALFGFGFEESSSQDLILYSVPDNIRILRMDFTNDAVFRIFSSSDPAAQQDGIDLRAQHEDIHADVQPEHSHGQGRQAAVHGETVVIGRVDAQDVGKDHPAQG